MKQHIRDKNVNTLGKKNRDFGHSDYLQSISSLDLSGKKKKKKKDVCKRISFLVNRYKTDIKNLKLEMCSQWISTSENVADP